MKIEEVKIHIFWDTCWNSFKFSGKMWLMLILKVTLKTNLYTLSLQTIYFLKYILKVKAWIFFNWNFNIIFSKLAIFHSIQIKTSLKKKLLEKSLGKRFDVQYMAFGICWCMSHMPKFWHMYVIMYGDFMVIVEPWPCTSIIFKKRI